MTKASRETTNSQLANKRRICARRQNPFFITLCNANSKHGYACTTTLADPRLCLAHIRVCYSPRIVNNMKYRSEFPNERNFYQDFSPAKLVICGCTQYTPKVITHLLSVIILIKWLYVNMVININRYVQINLDLEMSPD